MSGRFGIFSVILGIIGLNAFCLFYLPVLENQYAKADVELAGTIQAIVDFGQFMRSYGWMISIGVVLLFVGIGYKLAKTR